MKRSLVLFAVNIVFFVFALGALAGPNEPITVRIAAFNYYPAIFKADDGSVKGIYVDFLSEIAKRENWNIEYVFGNWADGLARIKTGGVDVLSSVAVTNERLMFMDYGKQPLLTVWAELYVPTDSSIDNIRQVKGKKIAIMRGDFSGANFRNLTEKFEIPCHLIEYSNFDDVFKAVTEVT